MTTVSKDALRTVLDAITVGATWRQCMAEVGAKENTAFMWQARSRDAEKAGDVSSVFYLTWPDAEDGEPEFFHKLIMRARARRAMVLEAQMVHEAISGHEEVVISDGKICWAEDPRFVGRDDFWMETMGFDPRDRILRDAQGMPVPLTRRVPMAATSRNMILQGTMPAVYGQHVNVNANVSKRVVHVMGEQRKPLSAALTDAERSDISELRRIAALPPKHPRPDSPVQKFSPSDSTPERVGSFAEDVPATPSPVSKPVSYARPAPSTDNPRGVQAERLDRGDTSRDYIGAGAPPPGGGRVAADVQRRPGRRPTF